MKRGLKVVYKHFGHDDLYMQKLDEKRIESHKVRYKTQHIRTVGSMKRGLKAKYSPHEPQICGLTVSMKRGLKGLSSYFFLHLTKSVTR